MDLQELLDATLSGAPCLGTFSLPEMLTLAGSRHLNALAVAKEGSRQYYLAFVNGEPEGAVYLDPDGALFGDKAVVHIRKGRQYTLQEVKYEIIDAFAMGCRIFEKGHIRNTCFSQVPEIGKGRQGIGVVTVIVCHQNIPQNGVRVSLRKDGTTVGSDITLGNGEVSFRVMYGEYTCLVQDRTQSVRQFSLFFDESHPVHHLDL